MAIADGSTDVVAHNASDACPGTDKTSFYYQILHFSVTADNAEDTLIITFFIIDIDIIDEMVVTVEMAFEMIHRFAYRDKFFSGKIQVGLQFEIFVTE